MINDRDMALFAGIIDEGKALLDRVDFAPGKTLNYILLQLYGKTLLTMSEIYTLLENGYPEGAMALSRNTYETMVIMTFLCRNSEDSGLIERFYDDYNIRTCQDHMSYLNWCLENGNDSEAVRAALETRRYEYDRLLEQYRDFARTKKGVVFFDQYWWVGKPMMSFGKLIESAGFEDNFFYDLACYRVHSGITGAMIRFDDQEGNILIGSTDTGREMPMYFSLLNFFTQTRLFSAFHGIGCSAVAARFEELNERLAGYFAGPAE